MVREGFGDSQGISSAVSGAVRRKAQAPFYDAARARHAVLLASVVGLKEASAQTGILASQICTWRTRIERLTGERFPRLQRANNRPASKLDARKAQTIRERRAAGVSWGVLARVYGVSRTACVKVWAHELYPDPAWTRAA